tara:strand:+ start:1718 stop:3346 length:1629 start_codon:yes stop_codon:yes gene_type:complete
MKTYTPEEKQEILRRMYVDPFFFAKFILGDETQPMNYHVRDKSPPFHKEIFNSLLHLKRGEKLAVIAPRGHAKSTLCSLIYPLHRVLFGEERFILLISESEMQSKYLLETIGDELEFNEKLRYFFGNRIGDVWGKEEKEIITEFHPDGSAAATCKIMVRGTGQKVRGLKYGAYRPTLTIIDDGEGDGNTATVAQRDKFRRWIDTAVVPGSDDGKIVFVGTIVDEDAYLNNVAGAKAFNKYGEKIIKGWKSLFYQSIIQDTEKNQYLAEGREIKDEEGIPKVLWRERRPYEWLIEKKEEARAKGDIAYFYQEYQNIPMDDSFRVFKRDDMQYWDGYYSHGRDIDFLHIRDGDETRKIPVNIFMGVDPASSENVKANYTVVMIIGVDQDNNIYVIDYFRGQVAPMDGAQKILELADLYKPKMVNIEETGHVMLADYLHKVSKKTGRFLHINTKKAIQKKFYRIKQMQPMFASKSVFLKEEHSELEQELLGFKEHGTTTKDTLDALRWAMDDIYAPKYEKNEEGDWEYPDQFTGCDWETGEIFHA